jgi:hypothetical protein
MTMTLLRPCAKTHVSHHLESPHNPVARPKHALQGALPYRASSTGETCVCLHGAITPVTHALTPEDDLHALALERSASEVAPDCGLLVKDSARVSSLRMDIVRELVGA